MIISKEGYVILTFDCKRKLWGLQKHPVVTPRRMLCLVCPSLEWSGSRCCFLLQLQDLRTTSLPTSGLHRPEERSSSKAENPTPQGMYLAYNKTSFEAVLDLEPSSKGKINILQKSLMQHSRVMAEHLLVSVMYLLALSLHFTSH